MRFHGNNTPFTIETYLFGKSDVRLDVLEIFIAICLRSVFLEANVFLCCQICLLCNCLLKVCELLQAIKKENDVFRACDEKRQHKKSIANRRSEWKKSQRETG